MAKKKRRPPKSNITENESTRSASGAASHDAEYEERRTGRKQRERDDTSRGRSTRDPVPELGDRTTRGSTGSKSKHPRPAPAVGDAVEKESPSAGPQTTPSRPRARFWTWPKTAIAAATAVMASIVAFSKTGRELRSEANIWFGEHVGSYVVDTAVVRLSAELRVPTKTEVEREKIVRQMSIMLDSQPSLVPIGTTELLTFIQANTLWPDGDLASCSASDPLPRSVQAALTTITKPRAKRRRYLFFWKSYRAPAAVLRLDGANLRRARLDSADLRGFNFERTCLWGATLNRAVLDSTRFSNARLDSARLEFTTGIAPRFSKARLTGASFNGAKLSLPSFRAARLACATFDGTTLDSADVPSARIEWSWFYGAHLPRLANGMRIDSTAVVGAFIPSKVEMDPALKAWLYRHGADSGTRALDDWTNARSRQWKQKGRCLASLREP
jgi:hypothetical protein